MLNDKRKLISAVEDFVDENPDYIQQGAILGGPGVPVEGGKIGFGILPKRFSKRKHQGMMFYVVGNRCQKIGNLELAITAFDEAIKRGYKFPSVYNNMASPYKKLGQYNEGTTFIS